MIIKFFIRDLCIEGIQIATVRLAKLLDKKGHNVEILTLYSDRNIDDIGNVKIRSLGLNREESLKSNVDRTFSDWLLSIGDFDYIFAPHRETIRIISNIDDKRLVPFIHSSDEPSYNKRSMVRKLKYRYKIIRRLKGKHVLCVSESIRSFLKKTTGKWPLSISAVSNPFDIKSLKNLALSKEIKMPEFENGQGEYYVYVGRLEQEKRVDRLLKAFSLMSDKNINLLIVGEGSKLHELEDMSKNLNIRGRVVFHPFVSNPYPLIARSKAFILTSDFEGLPTVLIESLILETPAFSVNCLSGPQEILRDELSPFLIDSFDERKIASQIEDYFNTPREINYQSGYERFSEDEVYKCLMKTIDNWK
ncbi:glycosyltransferase [Vibrio scophthalmi]|uniref:glycosyltransferase n=1 Tax=Vibrio scophthalmi TaxID=45658 RepID=UPI002FEF9128